MCLQVVKPLLQERTKLKVQVLQGGGRDELLKVNWFTINREVPRWVGWVTFGTGQNNIIIIMIKLFK